MDETTFQLQLRELKQRVSDMADTSNSWMTVPRPHAHPELAPGIPPNYHQDLYTAQLHGVKLKLDRMQANLPSHPTAPAMQTKVPFTAMPEAPDRLDYIRRDIQTLAGTIEASNDRAKQNFDDFKHSLDSMKRETRSGFEFLASRLRETNAFTPDASEATDEDLTAAHEAFPVDATVLPGYGYDDSGTAVNPEAQMVSGFDRNLPIPITEDYSNYLAEGVEARHVTAEECKNSPDDTLASQIATFTARQEGMEDARALNKTEHMGHTAGHHDVVSNISHDGLVGGKETAGSPHGYTAFLRGPEVFLQGHQAGFEGVTQLIQETCPRPAVLSEPFMAVCPPKIVHDPRFQWFTNPPKLPASCRDTSTKEQPNHEHGNITKEDAWSQLDPTPPEKAQLKIEQTRNQQLRDAIAAKDEVVADLEVGHIADRRDLAEKDAAIAHLNDCKSAAEEAFEITRSDLEKRLDEAKDRYDEAEDEIRRLEQRAESAERDIDMTEQNRYDIKGVLDMEIEQLRRELEQCEESRHHFMTKYVDENYRFKWLEQRKLQSEQRLLQQLDECEAALENSNRGRHIDIRNALDSRAGELDKLHMFCEEKDAVVRQQEQIIAQGASILQERDAEIDRLSAALDESKRSEQDAREHAAKNKRTIQKRDLQLEELHREAKEERERRCRLEDLMRRDAEAMRTKTQEFRSSADERDSGRSFANAGNVSANLLMSRGQPGRQNPLWTPQPLPSSARLPHEEDRASFWENGEHATSKHKFGSSSPIVQRRAKPGRHSRAALEHDNHRPPFPPNNVTEEESRGQNRQHSALFPEPSRHQSEPLASNREALQLLAGWTERTLQEQQKNSRLHEHRPLGPPQLTRAMHADMSHQRPAAGGGNGGGRRSSSSRMKAQAPTNGGTAENGRHALPLDTTWLPAAAQPAVEKVVSVPDLRAGSRSETSRNHASREHSAMSKPASMFDLRPQKKHMPSPHQTYRAPSVETEAESSSADEREQRQRNSRVDSS